MINKMIDYFKKLDILTYKIMKNGLRFCFAVCIIATLILLTYSFSASSPNLYYIGFSLFKLGCTLGVEFIICGLAMDTIKKQLI